MLLLVCFQCLEVYAYEEDHRCTDTEGNECETDPANVLLVHAMPSNRTENSTNPLSERNGSNRSDFIFSVVTSRSGSELTDIGSQVRKTDAGLKTSNIPSHQHTPLPNAIQDCLVPPEQDAPNPERNPTPQNVCVEISQSTYPKKECNMCGKKYIAEYLHDKEQICIVCKEIIKCRTQYNEHLLKHPDYFTTRCWVCTKDFRAHFSKHDKHYKCCACDVKHNQLGNFKLHNQIHRPHLLCKICGEEYAVEKQKFHDGSFPCSVCVKKFECQPLLEDHYYESHLQYLKNYCILCQKGLHKPVIEHVANSNCKCCQGDFETDDTYYFPNHLVTHTNLRLFKCFKCGKRYVVNCSLLNHSKKCIPLAFSCEICRLSFVSEVSLHEHHLNYHAHTSRTSESFWY